MLLLSRIATGYTQMQLNKKRHALDEIVGFVDGIVLAIARSKRSVVENVAYKGHKRQHALKFQALKTPDRLVLHFSGRIEGRRHDWTLYCRSGLEEGLPELLVVGGTQYAFYGDSGFNERIFLEISFQASQLTSYQQA